MPLLSVIVPVYNVEEHLERCLDSILNQTFEDFELLLINDGSPDNSHLICERYGVLDARIKNYTKQNGGLSSARNYGLDRAQGCFVSFVDSDDYLSLTMFESMISHLQNDEAEIAVCGRRIVHLDGRVEVKNPFEETTLLSAVEAVELLVEDEKINSFAWNKIYRLELFDGIRFPEGRLYEDIAVMFALFHRANTIIHLDGSYYFYIHNEQGISLSSGKEVAIAQGLFNSHFERYEFIERHNQYRKVVATAQKQALSFAIGLLHRLVLVGDSLGEVRKVLKKARRVKIKGNTLVGRRERLEHLFFGFPRFYYFVLWVVYQFKSRNASK